MQVLFRNLSLTEFQVRYLVLYLLLSVIDSFEWFWMGSLMRISSYMLDFHKGPFLFLHFSYSTLMTFLMLSVILVSMLMVLLCTLSVVCDNNYNWLVNLKLIQETR